MSNLNKDWKAKIMKEYLDWRKAEGIPSLPNDEPDERTKEEKQRQWTKNYYEKNKDAILIKGRLYNEAHKEHIAERNKQYRETHKDEISESRKAYRELHKGKWNDYHKTYYAEHKEDFAEKQKQYRMIKKECEVCGSIVVKSDFTKHLKTKKHIEAMKTNKVKH